MNEEGELWISHIWLNPIEKSHGKSIDKVERKYCSLAGVELPPNLHRMYWEERDEVETIVIQTPLKIIMYQRDEVSEEFKKLLEEDNLPIQLVRPLYENKLRWFFVQKHDNDSVIKYLTHGEGSSKVAYTYEDTKLWAICYANNTQWGNEQIGQGLLVTIDSKRKLRSHWVHWGKDS